MLVQFLFFFITVFLILTCNGSLIPDSSKFLIIESADLQPETLVYNEDYGLLVSSVTGGTIYKLVNNYTNDTKTYYNLVPFYKNDTILQSSVGFWIKNDLLYICHGNLSVVSEFFSNGDASNFSGFQSGLLVVNITTQRVLLNVDLKDYNYNNITRFHWCNDLAIDKYYNAYITDSFSGVIYKINPNNNNVEYFSYNSEWYVEGEFGPNGIDIDPVNEEFLIINTFYTSKQYKIPINNPMNGIITINYNNIENVYGLDGQRFYFDQNNNLYLYTTGNGYNLIYQWYSNDNWNTMYINNILYTEYQHPTSLTYYNYNIYTISSYLFDSTRTYYPIQKLSFSLSSSSTSSSSCSNTKLTNSVIILSVLVSIFGLIAIFFASRYYSAVNSNKRFGNSYEQF